MTPPPPVDASAPVPPLQRVTTFWRRTLTGPSAGARIAIYEELAPTVAAGIGLREALRAVADRHSGAKRRAVELLADGLDHDVQLAATMRSAPAVFSPIEAALVATGERTGRIDVALRAAAAQLERDRDMRNRIIQAVAYPLLVLHCFILMCSLVRMFGGGSFLLLAVPSFLALWGGVFAVASLHAAFAGSPGYARWVERVPVLGAVIRAGALARFARAFAALHGTGVSYDESLSVSAEASGNAIIRSDAALAVYAVRSGQPFSVALATMKSIPLDDYGLLIAGEQAGDLEGAANRVAKLEDDRFEVVTKRATAVLPGLLMLVMGAAVAFYAISFYANLYGGILSMK